MEFFIKTMINGITLGNIYALIALGYTMVYGIVGMINFAHGEVYMTGAFIALIVGHLLSSLGLPLVIVFCISLLAACVYAGFLGYTLEKVAYKPLRKSHRLATLISAIGASIFLQNFVLIAQGPENQVFPDLITDPDWLIPIGEYLRAEDILIGITTLLVMSVLIHFSKTTRTGLAMRAVAQDETMATLNGINTDKVISQTFVIGSVLAAIAGVLIGTYMGQINFYIGFIAGIKAFTAAVLGGIGSVPGAAIGGLFLGIAESLAAGYISNSYKDVVSFGLLILVLIFRPAGLLGKVRVEKV